MSEIFFFRLFIFLVVTPHLEWAHENKSFKGLIALTGPKIPYAYNTKKKEKKRKRRMPLDARNEKKRKRRRGKWKQRRRNRKEKGEEEEEGEVAYCRCACAASQVRLVLLLCSWLLWCSIYHCNYKVPSSSIATVAILDLFLPNFFLIDYCWQP